MNTVKIGSVVKILIDNRIKQTITIVSKKQYGIISKGNKNIVANLVVRSSSLGKAIAGISIGQTLTLKLSNKEYKIEILGIESSI